MWGLQEDHPKKMDTIELGDLDPAEARKTTTSMRKMDDVNEALAIFSRYDDAEWKREQKKPDEINIQNNKRVSLLSE